MIGPYYNSYRYNEHQWSCAYDISYRGSSSVMIGALRGEERLDLLLTSDWKFLISFTYKYR